MDPKTFEVPASSDKPSLPPPFISLPDIHNLRSIGLLPLPNYRAGDSETPSSGHVLKPGILFRSADPYNTDPHELKKLGIKTIFDLRSLPEVKKGLGWAATSEGEVADHEDITRVWNPVFEAEDYSPERLAERFAMYMDESIEVCPKFLAFFSYFYLYLKPKENPVAPSLELLEILEYSSPRVVISGLVSQSVTW